jgi:hypothetical protein
MTKTENGTGRKNTRPTTALGGHAAGTQPIGEVRVAVLGIPSDCNCAWQIHGEKVDEGNYSGLYWWTLKYRHTFCEAFRRGEHK